MAASTGTASNTELYDRDFFEWTQRTASLLRERCFGAIDIQTVAEEIEDMGKRDFRELKSRLTILVGHLLKWQFQPEKRTASWQSTIVAQRSDIAGVLEQSPSLQARLSDAIARRYEAARSLAASETGLGGESEFPMACPYTLEQILDQSYLPE